MSMKAIRAILPATVLGVLVLGTALPAFAQEKMTLEEWQARLDACNAREQTAQARIRDLDAQIAALRQQIAGVDAQINSERQAITNLNQQVTTTQSQLNTARADLETAQRQLDEALHPTSYTVVKGDCLWNIAKKPIIYNDPFKWHRIYEANKNQIKDPDLIYPKQVFKIPRP
jgi:nucleoid-associated protein YgaU